MLSPILFRPYSLSETGARHAGEAARAEAREARAEVSLLRLEVERLLMITEALWGILKEKHGYQDEELARRINDIDLRDGALDGRVAAEGEPPLCPTCNGSGLYYY